MKTKEKSDRTRELIKNGESLKTIHATLIEEFGESMSNSDIKAIRLEVDPKPVDDQEYKALLDVAYKALMSISTYLDNHELTLAEFTRILKDSHVNLERMRVATVLWKVASALQMNKDISNRSGLVEKILKGELDYELGWVYSFDELPSDSAFAKAMKKIDDQNKQKKK